MHLLSVCLMRFASSLSQFLTLAGGLSPLPHAACCIDHSAQRLYNAEHIALIAYGCKPLPARCRPSSTRRPPGVSGASG
eukprot:5909646-Pyramimonas_sp.AAC.1